MYIAKTSLESLPSHVMSYIKLPVKITKAIDKITRDFLWGSTTEKKTMHLVHWNTVTKDKSQGGLGIHKSDISSKAIIS